MIIRMEHVRQAKMCASGARAFFKRYNLDWNKFLTEGLPEEDIIATGDAMGLDVVEIANGRR